MEIIEAVERWWWNLLSLRLRADLIHYYRTDRAIYDGMRRVLEVRYPNHPAAESDTCDLSPRRL